MPEDNAGSGSGTGVGAGVGVGVGVGFEGGAGVAFDVGVGFAGGVVGGVAPRSDAGVSLGFWAAVGGMAGVGSVGAPRTAAGVDSLDGLLAEPQPAINNDPAASPIPRRMRITFTDAISLSCQIVSRVWGPCHGPSRVVLPSLSLF